MRLGVITAILGAGLVPPGAKAALDPSKALTQYVQQSWRTESGLPEGSVTALAKAAGGYLWIGTEEGLVRFDGLQFTVFDTRRTGLQSNQITALLFDHQQNLWIGTRGGGLAWFSNGRFKSFKAQMSAASQSILSLYEDSAGTLWIGTDGNGLIRYQDGKFKACKSREDGSGDSVFAISGDKIGNIWLGTEEGLRRVSHGEQVAVANNIESGHHEVRSVLVDHAGVVWAGTNGAGLWRVSSKGFER